MSKYRITDIQLCGNEHGQLRAETIYAKLIETKTGELVISATLEYILMAIRDRGLNTENVTVSWEMQRGAICSEVNLNV